MRISITLLALLSPLSVLFSCDNSGWEKRYGTLELFLSNCENQECSYFFLKDNDDNRKVDTDFIIKNLLIDAGEYKAMESSIETKVDYFTYYYYISPSTAGPNYCQLLIYENGYVVLDYKAALASHEYKYFSLNSIKALEINNYVKSIINS